MVVVSDTGPLIALDSVGRLDLLPALFGRIIVPNAVVEELAAGVGLAGEAAIDAPWLGVEEVRDDDAVFVSLIAHLDRGEAASLALAQRIGADLVIADDRDARLEATRRGIRVRGTLAVLIEAKEKQLIASVEPVIVGMRAYGMRLSDALVHRVLVRVGERS